MKDLFYKQLKINAPDNNIFFWSDTHWHQACEKWKVPIWKMRGFETQEEHDTGLKNRWNTVANNDSIFFHLGDIIFGYNAEERLLAIFDELKFKELYLMFGNHHAGTKQIFNKLENNVLELSGKKVIFCPNYLEAIINKQIVVMSHYPMISVNHVKDGAIHCHGHCHGNLYGSPIEALFYAGKTIDVGVENCKSPISYKELKFIMDAKPVVAYDHHQNETLI